MNGRFWGVGLCGTAGFACLALAVLLSQSDENNPSLVADRSVVDLGAFVHPDGMIPVTFRIRNNSNQSVTIIGPPYTCGVQGCRRIRQIPLEIPPLSSVDVEIEFALPGAGEFEMDLPLYTDSPTTGTMLLKAKGTVIEPASGAKKANN